MIAEGLGLDPLQLRRRNAVPSGDAALGGERYSSVGFARCFEEAAARAAWRRRSTAPRPESLPARGRRRGLGVAALHHLSAMFSAGATVKINEDGTAEVVAGAIDIGQGCEIIMMQIAAEELGLPLEDVHHSEVDSNTPFNCSSGGGRTTFTVGNSVRQAAQDAKRQLRELAAKTVEAAVADLEVHDRTVRVKGVPRRAVSYRKLSGMKHWLSGGPIIGRGSYDVEGPGFGFDPKRVSVRGFPIGPLTAYLLGIHIVEVDVDLETGQVAVVNVVAAHDVGRAINPTTVEGQIEGGVAQGIGQSLYEELCLDGGQTVNPSFRDFRIPSISDMPHHLIAVIVEEADKYGPFGAKGVGEPSLIATAAAIANAIYNAVGIRVQHLPITPEKVLLALEAKQHTESPRSS